MAAREWMRAEGVDYLLISKDNILDTHGSTLYVFENGSCVFPSPILERRNLIASIRMGSKKLAEGEAS
jgi:hypothetical protein